MRYLSFLHISEQFIKCGTRLKIVNGIEIHRKANIFIKLNTYDDDDDTSYASVYGLREISMDDNCIYQWKF